MNNNNSRTPKPDEASQSFASPAQVAEAIGVSVTTVKRWVDAGVLPAHRTNGGHRKLLMADILRLIRDGKLPNADLAKLLPAWRHEPVDCEELLDIFNQGVETGKMILIREAVQRGVYSAIPIPTLADRVISPALVQVGLKWEKGKLNVHEEHLISQTCLSALYELESFFTRNAVANRPVAVGGAPENDHSSIPSQIAKLTLLEQGWDVVNFGSHTPIFAFRQAIEEYQPRLLWISITHLVNPEQFAAEYHDLYAFAEARGVAVVLGGRGLTESLRSTLPYTSYGDGFSQFSAFAKSLHRLPPRPKRGRPPGTGSKSG